MDRSKDECVCGSRKHISQWIGCDRCRQWFHLVCARVTEEEVDTIVKFCCYMCTRRDGGLLTIYRCNACAGCLRSRDCGICASCLADPKKKCDKRHCALEKNDPYADVAPPLAEKTTAVTAGVKRSADGRTRTVAAGLAKTSDGRSRTAAPKQLTAAKQAPVAKHTVAKQPAAAKQPPVPKQAPVAKPTVAKQPAAAKQPPVRKQLTAAKQPLLVNKKQCKGCSRPARINSEYCSNSCWFKQVNKHISSKNIVLPSQLRSGTFGGRIGYLDPPPLFAATSFDGRKARIF